VEILINTCEYKLIFTTYLKQYPLLDYFLLNCLHTSPRLFACPHRIIKCNVNYRGISVHLTE
jgi:hypothetical protein